MGGPRRVANDPQRKARILRAALDVIAERGVHKTTHRAVAARAGVPLGSLTYHFDGLAAILQQAFAHLADTMSQHSREALGAARTRGEACEAVADLICGPEYASPREMTLLFEMYSYANHDPVVADAARQWMLTSRNTLSDHFSADACRALDALIEGWPMHRTFEHTELDRSLVLAAVTAIADRLDGPEAPAATPQEAGGRRARDTRT